MIDDSGKGHHRGGAMLSVDGEEGFRLIVENARDYAIFTTDSEGNIDSWPPGAANVFGWSSDEILGKPASMLFTPEDRESGAPRQELDTALSRGHAPDVRWHQHRSGSRVYIEGSVWPLKRADGSPRGFLKIGQDMTLRRQHEIALMESEERFRLLATTVPHLVFRSTTEGRRTWASPQWTAYTGMSDEQSEGYGWLEAIHPDDREVALVKWDEAGEDGELYYGEHRIRRKQDGMYRWHQTRAVPIRFSMDGPDEWVGSASDIHDMRQLQERQGILVGELQHRTRNLLAVVRSIASQTASTVGSLQEFQAAFDHRLGALSRVQGLLSRVEGEAVTVESLLRMELDAVTKDWDRIEIEGPRILVDDGTLQTLTLVIHELSTNAARHGALSDPEGRIVIRWFRPDDRKGDGAGHLVIEWCEKFSPRTPDLSGPRGFGRQLIEEAIPYQLGASTRFVLEETGLHCVLTLPLDPQEE
ncbi:PAS domain S-box protein [Pelagibacterium flavum]|uniref:Blue-light-activated histidine kinase n=1 Tax=Pelagibacterium flavum TaxID=2984530 RepID=A0ABY6ITB6_9HYPH|nr:PAS domain S-box protein [Pelagibacterium sp. YIM 151497]UYQ73891.1 PAS domain S-box protein [Pelagibacterium sp. YIM 151497]|eukprot:jgi/Tetstr1/450943/TSEL_037979.t1